jgi:hypothetical protein
MSRWRAIEVGRIRRRRPVESAEFGRVPVELAVSFCWNLTLGQLQRARTIQVLLSFELRYRPGCMWDGSMMTSVRPDAVPTLNAGPFSLRPFRHDDLSLVLAAGRDPFIPQITSLPAKATAGQARDRIALQHTRVRDGVGYPFVIAKGATDEPVGSIGLWQHKIGPGRASIGLGARRASPASCRELCSQRDRYLGFYTARDCATGALRRALEQRFLAHRRTRRFLPRGAAPQLGARREQAPRHVHVLPARHRPHLKSAN